MWCWLGPAWSCIQPGGQKYLFAEKTTITSAAVISRIKSSKMLELSMHVCSVYGDYIGS